MKKIIIVVYVVLIGLGVGTGYFLARKTASSIKAGNQQVISSGNTVGSTDTTTFKDTAEGTIEKGGSNGVGTHKLIRTGGDSQTVYLISSVVDLDQYVGKKVKIWGQTQATQQVAWLMDVGKVETSE
jgi:hypothetical protein